MDIYCFNLRFSVPYVINILKFQEGILAYLSWIKVSWLLLLLVFSFISIEVPLTSSLNPWHIRLCLSGEYFSIPMAISLIASLSHEHFWVYLPYDHAPTFLLSLASQSSGLPSCHGL
ncbi:hypothetical protein CK203_026565 [Vitis vinifera]|uniref:Uncharacterized protein n=1 Tax=Vitis vinifera TaxID=29760 RepID=A0A438IU03_VITVI|nr:hypothetical protein CK203_026565 [Vitis vinifera]